MNYIVKNLAKTSLSIKPDNGDVEGFLSIKSECELSMDLLMYSSYSRCLSTFLASKLINVTESEEQGLKLKEEVSIKADTEELVNLKKIELKAKLAEFDKAQSKELKSEIKQEIIQIKSDIQALRK